MTPLSLDDSLQAESNVRPWDRKYFKLIFLHFYQCGGEDHNFCTHIIISGKQVVVVSLEKEFLETHMEGYGSVVNFTDHVQLRGFSS